MPITSTALIERRILAVRIGNDPAIRPQEGLGQADMVYEEVMEGWWDTRFTALFLESEAERLRPLRSARLSGIYLGQQYNAAIVNTGASDGVRWAYSQTDVVNLDEFFHGLPYHSLSGYDYRGRMYSSTKELRDYLKARDLEITTTIRSYVFSPDKPKGKPALAVHIPYPHHCYVDWRYDPASGLYLRWDEGIPHTDALDGKQISAANVVILFAEHRPTDIVEDSIGATSINIILEGSGRLQVLRDGVVIEGTWKLGDPHEPIVFYDASGNEIALKPGKTWVQLVPLDYEVEISVAAD